MFLSMMAIAAAAASAQASDTTRASREAFTGCLRGYVADAMENRMDQAAFDREFPQACAAQQSAFRDSIIARETSLRASRAEAEDQANMEIEDARANFLDSFVAVPGDAAPAQAPAEAQAAATPAEAPTAPAETAAAPAEPAPAQPQ